jgi:hypothetical protein
LNKIAEPEEVAIQIAFLASHRVSGHTTGQVIMIHGGMEGKSRFWFFICVELMGCVGRLLNPKP